MMPEQAAAPADPRHPLPAVIGPDLPAVLAPQPPLQVVAQPSLFRSETERRYRTVAVGATLLDLVPAGAPPAADDVLGQPPPPRGGRWPVRARHRSAGAAGAGPRARGADVRRMQQAVHAEQPGRPATTVLLDRVPLRNRTA